MNSFAYRTTSLAIKTLSNLSKARVHVHPSADLPEGAKIFVINHFTRLETFLAPYYLHRLIKMPIWSLASQEFFKGTLGRYLESIGAVSTSDPHRDRLIIKTLLTNEAGWIIFPEGRMVKSKKIIEKGRHMVSYAGGKHPPHTGAAYLALRAEFYRQRLLGLAREAPQAAEALLPKFNLNSVQELNQQGTFLVPVNLTYYPLRARENLLNKLAKRLYDDLPVHLIEELMTEGSMLMSGVDIDMRLGTPIDIAPYLRNRHYAAALRSKEGFDFDDPLPCRKCTRRAALKITQRYMSAIYGLTTVNHDHIFASLLKHSLASRIDERTLRLRAYKAIQKASRLSIHPHLSLTESQNHLLIDDRFGKVADFMAVALDKGVIVRQPPFLLLDQRKLRSAFDFHRARIDNPVGVMANEVEPLTALLKQIRRLSWTPGFLLRAWLVKTLRRRAEAEFEADYSRYYTAEESKPKAIGRPFLIKGCSRRTGILLCHGYMAAPAEVAALARYLGRKGYSVYVPRLKGHGTSPVDLARCSYRDWIRSTEEGYLIIRNLCRQVFVGGFSTGAALALELAARIDGLAGVFAISTPLRLQDMSSRLAPVVDTWNRLMGRVRWEDAKKEFVENLPENPEINYRRNPISGVRELERLMDHLSPKLSQITIPSLVVQSREDPVVDPRGSERLFNLLGAQDKQYVVFNFKRHGILSGEGSQRVHQVVADFIRFCTDADGKRGT
jgi:esterase/lipase/1-acyl-sn-glycerol-3-phosphate acyltransferase